MAFVLTVRNIFIKSFFCSSKFFTKFFKCRILGTNPLLGRTICNLRAKGAKLIWFFGQFPSTFRYLINNDYFEHCLDKLLAFVSYNLS